MLLFVFKKLENLLVPLWFNNKLILLLLEYLIKIPLDPVVEVGHPGVDSWVAGFGAFVAVGDDADEVEDDPVTVDGGVHEWAAGIPLASVGSSLQVSGAEDFVVYDCCFEAGVALFALVV